MGSTDFLIWCQEHHRAPDKAAIWDWQRGTVEPEMVDLGDRDISFTDLVTLTGNLLGSSRASCPYCGNEKPWMRSLLVTLRSNSGDYYCFYCDQRGSVVGDGEVDPEKDAEAARKQVKFDAEVKAEKIAIALKLWGEADKIEGSPAEDYLRRRGITQLPPNVGDVLRFHRRCAMGRGRQIGCMVALFRDVKTDKPTGIHRTAIPGLWRPGQEVERRALGKMGAIKLWPANGSTLVVGEGIETVLSAAQHMTLGNGAPLRPAWAMTVARSIKYLPLLADIRRLVILVDHDASGTGEAVAIECGRRWKAARREVTCLMPKAIGDFNDVIRERAK